jgi:hypothetical protein
MTLQQVIDERISFLKEQINPNNKPEINSTFQIHIDTIIRSVDDGDIEKVVAIILQKKALLKNSKKMYINLIGCFLRSLMAWNGCSGI